MRLLSAMMALVFWATGLSVLAVGVSVYIPLTLVLPPRWFDGLIRIVCRAILLSSGQWLRVEGPMPDPDNGPYIYIFNHGSLFDAFVLMGVLPSPISAIGAQKQFNWPIWGTLLRRYEVIPIQRDERGAAIASMEAAEKVLAKGVSIIISPEGTRTLDGTLQPFKKGPFHVALNTRVKLLPVGLDGAYRAKPKHDWRIRPGVLTLRFGEPMGELDYQEKTVEGLRDLARERVAALI